MPRIGRFVYFLVLVISTATVVFVSIFAAGLPGQNVIQLRRRLLSRKHVLNGEVGDGEGVGRTVGRIFEGDSTLVATPEHTHGETVDVMEPSVGLREDKTPLLVQDKTNPQGTPSNTARTKTFTVNMTQIQVTRNVRNTTTKSLCTVEELNHISLLNSEQRRTLDAQVLVDDAHKFMFCFVPKVACSNWKRVIKYMNGKVPDLETPMKMDHHKDLVFLSDFTQDEVKYRLKNYFKFMFVRDPTERLLSAYRNKFGENIGTYNSKYGPKIIEKYRKPGFRIEGEDQSRITFEEFLRFTVDSDTRKMDPHWRPMHELCQPCAINYDFIGSFEQISEDASLVLDRIRGDSDAYFPKRQRWYKPTTDDRLSKELKHVHTEYLKQVVDKYARDYMLFGYPPPVSEVTRPKWS